jgi:hypothetical protein
MSDWNMDQKARVREYQKREQAKADFITGGLCLALIIVLALMR